MIGKIREKMSMPHPHWWHISLRVSDRGLTTTPIQKDKSAPGQTFEIILDGKGNNWNLSMNRAMGAVNRLIRKGVSPNQLSAVGRGEFAPVSGDDQDSRDARAKNRRVEFVITPKLSSISPSTNP